MRKVIAAINMTVDGDCDHRAGIPDAELHRHYTELLRGADVTLYGRITYGLMEYWREVVAQPTGVEAIDAFAAVMDKVPKVVFSRTLKSVDWDSARLATRDLEAEVLALREQPGGVVLVGCRSLMIELTKLRLIDEYQLCIHPVVTGGGLPLFEDLHEEVRLKLTGTKVFGFGGVVLYYERA